MVNFAPFFRFYDRFKVGGKEERGGGKRRPEQPPSEEKHSQLYACHDCGLLVPCTEPKVSSGHRPALECPSGKYDSRSTMQVFIQLHSRILYHGISPSMNRRILFALRFLISFGFFSFSALFAHEFLLFGVPLQVENLSHH